MAVTQGKPLPTPSKEISRVSDINTVFTNEESKPARKTVDTALGPKKELSKLSSVKPGLAIPPEEKTPDKPGVPEIQRRERGIKIPPSFERNVSVKNVKEIKAEQDQDVFNDSVLGYLKSIDSNLKDLLNLAGNGGGIGNGLSGGGGSQPGSSGGPGIVGSLLGGYGAWKLLKGATSGALRGGAAVAKGGWNLGRRMLGLGPAAKGIEAASKAATAAKGIEEASKAATAAKGVEEASKKGSLISRILNPIKSFISPPPAVGQVLKGSEIAAQGLQRSKDILAAGSKGTSAFKLATPAAAVIPEVSALAKAAPVASSAAGLGAGAKALGAGSKLLKAVPVVGQAIAAGVAIYDAFDDEAIKKMSGKEEIAATDRIANAAGGFVGSFGSIADLGLSAAGIEGTNIGGFLKETTGKIAVDTFDSAKTGLSNIFTTLFGPKEADLTAPTPPKAERDAKVNSPEIKKVDEGKSLLDVIPGLAQLNPLMAIPSMISKNISTLMSAPEVPGMTKAEEKKKDEKEESFFDSMLKLAPIGILPMVMGSLSKNVSSLSSTITETAGLPGGSGGANIAKPKSGSSVLGSILTGVGVGGAGALALEFAGIDLSELNPLDIMTKMGDVITENAQAGLTALEGAISELPGGERAKDIVNQLLPNGLADITPDFSRMDLPATFPGFGGPKKPPSELFKSKESEVLEVNKFMELGLDGKLTPSSNYIEPLPDINRLNFKAEDFNLNPQKTGQLTTEFNQKDFSLLNMSPVTNTLSALDLTKRYTELSKEPLSRATGIPEIPGGSTTFFPQRSVSYQAFNQRQNVNQISQLESSNIDSFTGSLESNYNKFFNGLNDITGQQAKSKVIVAQSPPIQVNPTPVHVQQAVNPPSIIPPAPNNPGSIAGAFYGH